MPSIRLHEQKIDHEFAAILDCANVGYATPFNGFWEVLKCPVLEEQVQRTAQSHREDESSRWVYITDEETGQCVGAMEWNFYKENPYAQGPPEVTADWWQEGTPIRKISDCVLKEFIRNRSHAMKMPHAVVSCCVTRPTHRRMGVATMMMEWGLKVADKMNLPAFVESTLEARKFYEKNGFDVIDNLELDAPIPNQSDKFEQLRAQLMPVPYVVMTRPLEGKSN